MCFKSILKLFKGKDAGKDKAGAVPINLPTHDPFIAVVGEAVFVELLLKQEEERLWRTKYAPQLMKHDENGNVLHTYDDMVNMYRMVRDQQPLSEEGMCFNISERIRKAKLRWAAAVHAEETGAEQG